MELRDERRAAAEELIIASDVTRLLNRVGRTTERDMAWVKAVTERYEQASGKA